MQRGRDIRSNNDSISHIIPGFHAVKEALHEAKIRIDELWIADRKRSSRVKEIVNIAENRGIPVFFKKSRILDNLVPDVSHQGILALAGEFAYFDINYLISVSSNTQGHALILATDHMTDEGNLGALMRTAAFFGVHGLILPKDRSAKVTEKVRKRSSGAYLHLPVARVVNLGRSLDVLNKKGFWIIGAAEESPDSVYQFDWNRDLILVLGSEDRGLSRSVRSRCHQIVSIPSYGYPGSLNISVAGGIILAEIIRQRSVEKSG
ncbi:MAG: 23S rRNA (guanosine(2251)-2'-O)-methyltransferase RlmB [Deltaproteobacteria bacterium]|nr:23S rRNA (guanosine(2251)-2'-O)-methyltransferase RlmB [Deltaproteobacteria bacterium]